jgi:hypothetical protein
MTKKKFLLVDTLPEDIQALVVKVEKYQDTLDEWGLKDYQVGHNSSHCVVLFLLLLCFPASRFGDYLFKAVVYLHACALRYVPRVYTVNCAECSGGPAGKNVRTQRGQHCALSI